jgi:hypothetical protein
VDAVHIFRPREKLAELWWPRHELIVPSRTDARPGGRAPKRFLLTVDAEHVAELGDHPRAPHRTTSSVSQLPHVDSPGDVGVAVTDQKCDLVHALAREQRPARNGVAEAVHRR